jgi:hypothetical protein
MTTFILEDDMDRVDWFRSTWSEHSSFVHAIDYATAILLLPPFPDMLLLDHDLGGEIYVDPNLHNTGSNFCRWLTRTSVPRDLPVIIHSHNPVGSEFMKDILMKAGFSSVERIPFGDIVRGWNRGTLSFFGHYRFDRQFS